MRDESWIVWAGLGLAALGVGVFFRKGEGDGSMVTVFDANKKAALYQAFPMEARPYFDVIIRVAQETGVDPLLIAAIGQQETRWGTAPQLDVQGPAGRADRGHGHGLMQIDDRTHGDWIASRDWTDPYTNVSKAAAIWLEGKRYLAIKAPWYAGRALDMAAVGAYNHGAGNIARNLLAGNLLEDGLPNPGYIAKVDAFYTAYTNAFAASTAAMV